MDSSTSVVLLIGATGEGKSSLGSFLVNLKTYYTMNPAFARASSARATTLHVQALRGDEDDVSQFKFVDTPGLNESGEADMMHMGELVKSLGGSTVAAVILCVKLTSKFTENVEKTVKYYSQLLPACFNSNLLLVVTDTKQDADTREQRNLTRFDVDDVKLTLQKDVQRVCGLSSLPTAFTVDSFTKPPTASTDSFTKPPSTEPESPHAIALNARNSIVCFCQDQVPIQLSDIKLRKTPWMVEKDNQRINRLDGEKEGSSNGLRTAEVIGADVHSKLEDLFPRLAAATEKYTQLEAELRVMDSVSLVQVASGTYQRSWTFTWNGVDEILHSPYPIHEIRTPHRLPSGVSQAEATKASEYSVQVLIKGQMFRGFHYPVTVFSRSCDRYQQQILEKKQQVQLAKAEFDLLHKEQLDLLAQSKGAEVDRQRYQRMLDNIDQQLTKLYEPFVSMSDLQDYLPTATDS